MVPIVLTAAVLLALVVVVWRIVRKILRAAARSTPPKPIQHAESNSTGNDDLVTGLIIGSVLFGGDSHASSPSDSGSAPDASGDTGGSIGGSSDGFDTGGEF
jgi:hypothetical protein